MPTEQTLKEKIQIGDFVTLGKMLKINPENARMRFKRGKADAVEGIKKIIAQRDALIKELQNNDL